MIGIIKPIISINKQPRKAVKALCHWQFKLTESISVFIKLLS